MSVAPLRPDFEVEEEPTHSYAQEAAYSGLLLALKALSQRFVIAVANLFTFVTVFGVWWLWRSIPDPSPTQIMALSIYATFTLAVSIIVSRRR